MNMTALIIEDEGPAANRLKKLLEPGVSVVGVCDSVEASVKWLNNNPSPSVILMDIELADGISFNIFKKTVITSPVIFTTAYDKFAIEALKLGALDYLLKPIDKEELTTALKKTSVYAKKSAPSVLKTQQDYLTDIATNEKPKKLAIRNLEDITFIEIEKIIKLKADSNYSHIYLNNGKQVTASKTLKDFEDLLSGYGFFRVHSSHLINLAFVEKYLKGEGGFVVMSDGSNIEVSRDRKKALLSLLTIN